VGEGEARTVWLSKRFKNASKRELLYCGLAGAFGGALGWLAVEPVVHRHYLGQAETHSYVILYFASSMLLWGAIGGLILAAEGSPTNLTASVRRNFKLGFIFSAGFSIVSTFLSNRMFSAILALGGVNFNGQGEMVTGSVLALVLARTVGWSIDGLVIGSVIGTVSGTFSKTAKGLVGGSIGGFAGGLVFDALSAFVGGALVSRLCGFVLEGFVIGLGIGLVQELTKGAWLTVEEGRIRGRQFRIDKSIVRLGRAEENDVGLFGDAQIAPVHAHIEHSGSDCFIVDTTNRNDIKVNNSPLDNRQLLLDGDRIAIGSYILHFHEQQPGRNSGYPVAPSNRNSDRTPPVATHQTATVTGPDGSRYFLWPASPLTIGRDKNNVVSLPSDNLVSRFHAVITSTAGQVTLRDLNSSNGTLVNDYPIKSVSLSDGDAITVGNTRLIFRRSVTDGAESESY
jgi:pSer/pThr/pTyr-binding forkhead associated (FHA) protein